MKQFFHSRLFHLIADLALRASLTIYHLISSARSWNNIFKSNNMMFKEWDIGTFGDRQTEKHSDKTENLFHKSMQTEKQQKLAIKLPKIFEEAQIARTKNCQKRPNQKPYYPPLWNIRHNSVIETDCRRNLMLIWVVAH